MVTSYAGMSPFSGCQSVQIPWRQIQCRGVIAVLPTTWCGRIP